MANPLLSIPFPFYHRIRKKKSSADAGRTKRSHQKNTGMIFSEKIRGIAAAR